MSLKSKRNREKRKRERRQKYLKSLSRKSELGIPDAEETAFGPDGHEKMSEVLIDFVAPYTNMIHNEEAYRRLLTIAIFAWNICLLPPKEQQGIIATVINEGLSESDPETKAGLVGILGILMVRKRALFSDNKRFILSFAMMETETGFDVSVISSLEPPTT